MKDLKCGLTSCKHNKGYCCCSKSVDVDRHADCLTYSPDQRKGSSMFEAGEDFVKANYSVDTSVSCTADCIFNRDNVCRANGITVMSEKNKQPGCLTYIKA